MRTERGLAAFVRGLADGSTARRTGDRYVLPSGMSARAARIGKLIAAGVLTGDQHRCAASSITLSWLRRGEGPAGVPQRLHRRVTARRADGTEISLEESPLARLATARFLEPHQIEAGERFRRLFERARLQPRLTPAYGSPRVDGAGGSPDDIPALALDARRKLAEINDRMPRECAGVLHDVCGMLKGLQEVERDRCWPRRSAKLVLRIALEHLAQHFGLSPLAIGAIVRGARKWRDPEATATWLRA